MSNFSLGFKSQIVNSPDQNLIRFFKLKAGGNGYELVGSSDDYSGDPAVADTPANKIVNADRVVIDGFTTLDKGTTKNAIGTKGIEGVKPELTLTFALNAVTEMEQFIVRITLESPNYESEFQSRNSWYKRSFDFPLIVKPGDAPADVIARLETALGLDSYQDRPFVKVVSKTATTIVLTTSSPAFGFSAIATGDVVNQGKVTVTPSTTKVGYEGRNNYDALKGFRVETDATLQPLNVKDIQRQGLPEFGALYTSITLEKDVERPELHGATFVNGKQVGDSSFQLFINQKAEMATYLQALTAWINANVAVRDFYPATTAALAVASPETVQKFTEVAAAPYTDGLS